MTTPPRLPGGTAASASTRSPGSRATARSTSSSTTAGDVADCFFQVPELRGFEKFCEGRPVEEMPRITPRICGVCPEAHMMASAKACDAVYKVDAAADRAAASGSCSTTSSTSPTTPRTSTRSAAPDFVMGPDVRPGRAQHHRRHPEAGRGDRQAGDQGRASGATRRRRSSAAGRSTRRTRSPAASASRSPRTSATASRRSPASWSSSAKFTLKVLHEQVLGQPGVRGPDPQRAVPPRDVLDGARGREEPRRTSTTARCGWSTPRAASSCKYTPREYSKHVAERVEPWSYLKFPYLTQVGWKGFVDGKAVGRLPRHAAVAPERRRRDEHAARAGGLRGVLRDADGRPHGPQAGPPHAGHPLGAGRRAGERRGARARAGAAPRAHAPRALPRDPDRHADRGRRHRRGAARHARRTTT